MSDTLPTTTADAPLLELRGLTKHFPLTQGVLLRRTVGQVQAVDGVSFAVANVTGILARLLEGRPDLRDADGLLRELRGAG